MVAIKLANRKDIRRISLEEPLSSYSALVALAKETFGTSYPKREFIFKYKDTDGDLISVLNDKDLAEALKVVGDGTLKLELTRTCCFREFIEDDNQHQKVYEFVQQKKKEFCERSWGCGDKRNGGKKCGKFMKVFGLGIFAIFLFCTFFKNAS